MVGLGSQLGLVGKSGFDRLLSGLFEAGSVLLLPATDGLSYMNLIFLYISALFSRSIPVAEVQCVDQPDPPRCQAPVKQVLISGKNLRVEYIKIDERNHSGTIRLGYLSSRTWQGRV